MASSATVVAVAPTNSCCFHVSSAKPTRFHSIRMNQPPKSCLRIRAYALGISETFSDLRRQGRVSSIYWLIVPDLPLEESANLRREAAKKKVDMVLLTTPTTTKRKMKAISDASEGFIYLVSILLICKYL
ncbi:hypothetical protein BHM03_00037454 [Ensete ventricosum]|uniref:tryptophan synthase n=1 Tax=Ensete ventricosum TaxID=4639 RepID=A0A445MJN2_ENSVE|nr:hypothetical protein BHM03_00037454 [Ensete ventricosum]